MPPSPDTTTLVGDRLNTSASPNPPTLVPARVDPNAWAASKNSRTPRARARAVRLSTSAGVPNVWVARMAEVRTPMAWRTLSGDRVSEARSTSAKTGLSPFQAGACAVAVNVNDGTTTEPDRSAARSTSISPAVHDDTATHWRTPR